MRRSLDLNPYYLPAHASSGVDPNWFVVQRPWHRVDNGTAFPFISNIESIGYFFFGSRIHKKYTYEQERVNRKKKSRSKVKGG